MSRELIFAEIVTLLGEIPGIVTVKRNDTEIPESLLPAIGLLDGDENVREELYSKGRNAGIPLIVDITFQVFIIVQTDPNTMGSKLNNFRDLVKDKLFNTESLLDLLYCDEIKYLGLTTAFAAGRTMQGEMTLTFKASYTDK